MTIRKATRLPALAAAIAAMTAAQGCSMALDWLPDHLPCDGMACDAGFSCLPEAAAAGAAHGCVRDESLKLGLGCALDQQCKGTNRCVAGACRAPCSAPYQPGVCPAEEVCDQPLGAAAPACVPSDGCVPGGTCWDGQAGLGVCVPFSDKVRRCLRPCSADLDSDASAACPQGSVCAAMGLGGQQELVCVPQTASFLH